MLRSPRPLLLSPGWLCRAAAKDGATQDAVVATRSFPKTNAVKKNILAEASSTQVESDSDWGGVESLNVPQTKSQAEKDVEAAAAAAEQQRQQQAQAQAQAKPLLVPPSKRPQQQRLLHRDAA